MADVITGSEVETDVMAGWKGDATAGGGFGNDDYCSNLDAVNIVCMMNDSIERIFNLSGLKRICYVARTEEEATKCLEVA